MEKGLDDTLYGNRDKRGYWTPKRLITRAPVFVWPVQPIKFLRYMFGSPGYIWPRNAAFLVLTFFTIRYLTPSLETMRNFSVGWISLILLRNAVLELLICGGLHFMLYIRRRQQTAFKYNARWPEADNSSFLFGSQTAENVFWTMCSGVPVWTAYEAVIWWMYANGYIARVDFAQHPIYCVALLLLVPLWEGIHFYVVHRLIHMGPLYHWIHKVHHNSFNPGPWSGLSMHTFEHLIYFSLVLIVAVVPSNPIHSMFMLMFFGLHPAIGHLGFHAVATRDGEFIDNDIYFHYLHHKYFEVNYGGELHGLDWLFGTAHDGSPEAEEAMYKRMKAKKYVRGSSQG
ncbi:sterol desaturase family protein [Bradyrhizobium sp. B097]|uniref:sterol desaturase family protein n=1 Tax=Bradyrhizobium sp. B097 TaxID=3140244 RepID=UPI003183C983